MGEVAHWQRTYAAQLTIAVVNRGTAEAVRAKAGEIDPALLLLQQDGEVAAAYLAGGTPSAVLVGADGIIRSPLAAGATAVRQLVAQAGQPPNMPAERLMRHAPIPLDGGQPAPTTKPAIATGALAPAFELPDLNGKIFDNAQLRGASTLVLFWNPTCGFCRRMLSNLQAWEAEPPHPNAPHLLLISTGTVEANQAQGLRAPILLDSGFRTGNAFGARGTPSAVLIDAEGKVAGELVVGASSILPMLSGAPATTGPMVTPSAAA
jgi:thiol-disulfide isomerase/thioredoxin